ncbi:MAG: head GIN domain-containing protein [Polaribacter sp.]|jgi:CxxC motif-containing protein
MKKLLILLILTSSTLLSQVKGNKTIETRTYKVTNLKELKVNLYAKITVDQGLSESMQITTDSNLFDKIDTEIVDGTLNLNQLEWIQPSQSIIIKIGAPKLERLETGTHETLYLNNVNTDFLNIMALIGKVVVSGNVNQFNVGVELGEVEASKLIAENARVNIWGRGKATVYAKDEIYSIVKNDGKLVLANTPKSLKGDTKRATAKTKKSINNNLTWISFKIKNNSWNRNNFVVVGPKKDGSSFSYGFPMMPGFTRKEKWSVGTKVYKVNRIGLRKLLVEIKADDKDKTVKLFQ